MTDQINLSARLSKVASFLPLGANFADIGSDHAYLACYVCLKDQTARAVAGEIKEGPLSSAKETVAKYDLFDAVDVRLGNGLSVVSEGEVEQVVIAGMGGSLIKTILEEGKDKLRNVNQIIAQPNVDEKNVRAWYVKNGFAIQDEVILEENGHLYEIIVGKKQSEPVNLSEKDLLFGPLLLKLRDPLFYIKWQSERNKLLRIIRQMKNAKVQDVKKIGKFEIQLTWIEEVLRDGKINA